MSSEESSTSRSSSSRLSQFGIYRTIDARTEEFLNLSKKRQIRQGCACAVISTAFTVTIVIGIFLIFEYNGYSNLNPQKESLKISNVTKYAYKEKSRHEENNEKVNKKKHIISTSTINLLNLLLKALNHTHNLEGKEKSYPTIKKIDATVIPFKRNVFPDIKNWIRIPNLRMLADHKVPSIVYYRNPTSNVRLSTNTKKSSVYSWPDITKASEEVLEKNSVSFVNTDHPRLPIIIETSTTLPKNKTFCPYEDGQNKNCNCSKLSAFLCKVFLIIQEMFPGVILNTTVCDFNNKMFVEKSSTKIQTTSTLMNKITDTEIGLTKKHSDKNKVAETIPEKDVYRKEIKKLNVTGDVYKKHKNKLQTSANNIETAKKYGKTHLSLNENTTNSLEKYLRSGLETKTKADFTTLPPQPYIVEPELLDYLKHFIKSTTAAKTNKSDTQPKTLENLRVTDTMDTFIETTIANKDEMKNLATNTQKSTNKIKKYQYKTSSEKITAQINKNVTLKNFAPVDMHKKYINYVVTNINQSSYIKKNDNFQNRKNKILTKSPLQLVMKKIKIITERPEYTTISVKPYIPAPQFVEYKIKSTTPTSIFTSAITTTQKHHEQNIHKKNVFDETTKSTDITTQENSLTGDYSKKNFKTASKFAKEKALDSMIKRSDIVNQKETVITATAIKPKENERTLCMEKTLNGPVADTENITQSKTKLNINTETASDETIRSTKITSQKKSSTEATTLKQDEMKASADKDQKSQMPIKINEVTTQKEALSADVTKWHEKSELEEALNETIRTIDDITHDRTSTDITSKKCDEIKQNKTSEEVYDPNRNTGVTTQEESSTATAIMKHNKIQHILDLETTQNSIKPTQIKKVAKYFKDDIYEENKSFKDIKFARFDSFAANSNKHIILPSYKDLNFELFPIFKRHNTNAPKFDTTSELLLNNDPRIGNDFAEIMSNHKKDYYLSTSNEIFNTQNPNKTNKIKIKSSSMPIEVTSPVNWIFEIKMMNDKIKESLKETANAKKKNENSVLHESIKGRNQNVPDVFDSTDEIPIWSYNIDSHLVETTTPLKLDYDIDKPEITNTGVMKIILPDTKPIETYINKQAVSISQLYDTNEGLVKYLRKTMRPKINETNKEQLNISLSDEFTFFEDRIQEKLKYLRDTKTKANINANTDITIDYLSPSELKADYTEYNPSSMLPKSRPSYLEINRNFLNTDEDQDYRLNRVYYKQKRQDYAYF